jgi:hypothetical protein
MRPRNRSSDGIKTGAPPLSGKSMAVTYLLAMRCPVYRQRDFHLGFDTELENLIGGGKGKGKRKPREVESTETPVRGGLPRTSVRGKPVERRGQVTGVGIDGSTGNGRNRPVLAEGGSLHSVARAG